MKRYSMLMIFLLAFAISCSRNANTPAIQTNPSGASKVYTPDELHEMVIPGMSIADVTNKFGLPGSAVNIGEGKMVLSYTFPINGREKLGTDLIGFGIQLSGGRVQGWTPITGAGVGTAKDGGSEGYLGEQVFTVLLAPDNQSSVTDKIRAQGYADVGDLSGSARVIFTAKVYVGTMGTENAGEMSVGLDIDSKDSEKLAALTADGIGKRLLIICRNKVIAAPVVKAVLNTNQLIFTVGGSKALDILRGK